MERELVSKEPPKEKWIRRHGPTLLGLCAGCLFLMLVVLFALGFAIATFPFSIIIVH